MKSKSIFNLLTFKIGFLIFFSAMILSSCNNIDLFEKQSQIPSQQWFYNNVPEFTFHIEDTSATYHLYVVLRHTDLYQYNNIWLQVGSKAPQDSMKFQKLNLSL